MDTLVYIGFFIIGLIMGSFYNVVGLRVPKGELLEKTRSYCPHCQRTLRAYELIPVLSYLIQLGKCRTCKKKIAPLYPLVELATGILFSYNVYIFGFSAELIISLLFVSLLMIIIVTDLKYMLIPNKILIFFLPLFLLFRFLFPVEPWYDPLLGGALGYLIIAIIILASNGGMGAGDMKLMGVLGIVIGWKGVLLTLFLASLIGGLISLVLIFLKITKRKQPVPFGPYIALGALISYYYGEQLMAWYVNAYL